MNKPIDHLRTLDIITREVGLLELEDPQVTPDDRRWAESVVDQIHAQITEHRRTRVRALTPSIRKAEPISDRLRAMPRVLLEALFSGLVKSWGPHAQLAHRGLEMLSDNDLRRLIQTIEAHTIEGQRGTR